MGHYYMGHNYVAYIVMAYIVMAYIVIAYIVIAYIVMACIAELRLCMTTRHLPMPAGGSAGNAFWPLLRVTKGLLTLGQQDECHQCEPVMAYIGMAYMILAKAVVYSDGLQRYGLHSTGLYGYGL